ncbi:MAG: gliding motility-associated C-terminal domain-containing protein [Arcicella sp.]|nr:gliding motility-associated C-terminal domain-containing protein [Arcicella sp.]
MPKRLSHRFLLFVLIFFSSAWVSNAQTTTIVKDGVGICPDGAVKISSSDASLVTYQWQRFVGSAWSAVPYENGNSLSIGYVDAGRYRLVATNNLGQTVISNELDLVQLVPPPVPIITPSRNTNQICQGDSLILRTTFQSGYQYFWSYNNTPISMPQSVTLVAKKAGVYTLKVTDQSPLSNGCSTNSANYNLDYTTTITLKIDSIPPICSLTAPPVNLTATPAGGTFKGRGITNASLGTFNPSTAGVGKHEISYEVAQNGSCPSLVDKRTFIVSDPKATINTNTGKTQFCQGDIATLSAPAGMKKYEWLQGSNIVGTLAKLDVGAGGDFQLRITDEATCTNTSPVMKIEFFSQTNVSADRIPSVCGTEYPVVPLRGNPSGGAFTINGDFATTFDYKKLGIGKHKVLYKLDGTLPCLQGNVEQEVEIQDFPKPNLGTDILLGKGNGVVLKGFIDQNLTYVWTPSTGLDDPTLANPTAKPTVTTEYTLTAKTTLGCEGKGKINVVVYQPVYIPTAFSPNGDGMNDVWELQGLEVYPSPEVQIFNRWGNVIYYSKGTYTPFDGTDNAKKLPEGMYVYKINPFPDRPDFKYQGTFMLLR